MEFDSDELAEYIKAMNKSIKDGYECDLMIPRIEVELTVTHQKAKEGSVKILIASLENGSFSQQTSRIRFSVENLLHKHIKNKFHKLSEWITEKHPE